MYLPNEEPIEPQPERPQTLFIDELVVELVAAVDDLTRRVRQLERQLHHDQ